MILLTLPALLERLEHLVNEGRYWQWDTVLTACRERASQIFMMKGDLESRLKIVLQEIGAPHFHNAVGCQTTREDLDDDCGVHASLGTKHQRFAYRLNRQCYHNLVARLDNLPRASPS